MDDVLVESGEKAAAFAYDELQKSLKKAAGKFVKVTTSTSERNKYIRDSGKEFKRTATPQERQNVENEIYEIIKLDMSKETE